MSLELLNLRENAWSLDDFVEIANHHLPNLLPKDAGKRAADPVNQRLVRHYSTQGLLDEPLKEGREARYLFRHLLQLLVVRRLLAEGFTAAVVARVLADRSDEELQSLLSGDLRIELVPAAGPLSPTDERTEFLRRIRRRAGLDTGDTASEAVAVGLQAGEPEAGSSGSAGARSMRGAVANPNAKVSPSASVNPSASDPLPYNPFDESSWSRIKLLDGLELSVRDDFRMPDTRLGDEQLSQLLKVTLLYLEQKQRGKP